MAEYITTVLKVFSPRVLDKLSYDQTLESFILTVYMYVGGLLNNAAAINSNGSSCSRYHKLFKIHCSS
jgi:hypothetical protein